MSWTELDFLASHGEVLAEPGSIGFCIRIKETDFHWMGKFLPANFASHRASWSTLFVGDKSTETFLDTDVLHLLDSVFCMPIWLVSDVSLSSFAGLKNKFPFIIWRWVVLAEPCAFTSWVLCQERSIKLERKLFPGNFPSHWMLHARFIVDETTVASFNTDLFQLVD